ncbi:MAG: hypothetical protein U0Q07_15985 [Acidimicrobiales bacterium]
MRRWLAAGLVLAAAVPIAACSKSDGPTPAATTAAPGSTSTSAPPGTTKAPGTTVRGGSTGTTGTTPADAAAYCTVVRDNEQLVKSGFSEPAQASDFLAVLGKMEDAAPASQKANVAAVRKVAEGLVGVSPAEADRKMLDLLQQPDVLEAAASLSDFTDQACGVQLQSTSAGGSSGGTGDTSGGGSSGSGGGSATPTLDELKAAVQAAANGAPWFQALNGWSIGSINSAGQITITADATDTPLDKAGAIAACEAAAAWGTGKYGTVEVSVTGPNLAVLASKGPTASSCTAA